MSLLITMYVPEGIVLSGDSRLTVNWSEKNNKGQEINYSVNGSDNYNKIFNIQNKFGLGSFGTADIKGIPVSGFINEFIEEKIQENTEINEIPPKLHEFFGQKYNYPDVNFYLSGYKTENGISIPYVYFISIGNKSDSRININGGNITFGANWGGEIEILQRLIQDVKIKTGNEWHEAKAAPILYNFITLQDAIDFCEYGIKTTIETLRFQKRAKTVGGAIDTLIIRPKEGAEWIRKKELKSN